LAADDRAFALNANPAFLSLSAFSYEGTETPVVSTINPPTALATLFPAFLGEIRRQRVEFGYADVTSPVNTAPVPTDHAIMAFTAAPFDKGITFAGDLKEPVFTRDAKVRLFWRRPLFVDGAGFSITDAGFEIPRSGGLKTLYHSMQEASDTVTVYYGNPNVSGRRSYTVNKDRSERFLDEIYRYPNKWAPLAAPMYQVLLGPGMVFAPAPIFVPVRPTTVGGYDGWYLLGLHLLPLDNVSSELNVGLQVTGWPERNPDYKEGLAAPFPSRGMLVYPKTDYTAGYDPVGADYSVLVNDRVYIRAFDAGDANAGASTVKFRLWGLGIPDFKYDPFFAPGGEGIAITVKIPGLTTWMDAGRADGSGPSKQDITLDGAGCLVSAVQAVDAASQLTYTDITVNVGPAFLFLNTEVPARCPVLVKVIIKDSAVGKALDFTNVVPTAPTPLGRGLVGIDVI